MILITGAAGKTGLAVIRELKNSGEGIRAFVKTPEQLERVLKAGASEGFQGSLENKEDLRQALIGVRAVYHICPNMHPAEIEIGRNLIDACRQIGTELLVYHSVFHPQIEAMPHHWNKLRVEEILIGSGVPYTIFQPTAYMQNILARKKEILEHGIYRIPYDVNTRISMVDLDDVAECAVKALIGVEYDGGTFELVGPGFWSQVEIANALSAHLNRSIKAEEIPLAGWRDNAERAGISGYALETLTKMFAYYDQYNFKGNTKVLEDLLGRAPTTFEDFLKREF